MIHRRPLALSALLALCAASLGAQAPLASSPAAESPPAAAAPAPLPPIAAARAAPGARDVARPAGLPEIGKWMIAPDGNIASWLGWKFRAKELREPINVIVFDALAKTADEAYARLEAAAGDVEFEMRIGHSSGYTALIGGIGFEQLPQGNGKAISDGPFELSNNHGRIFGPYRWKEGWLFTAAFKIGRAHV
jgi:hypothetical protein